MGFYSYLKTYQKLGLISLGFILALVILSFAAPLIETLMGINTEFVNLSMRFDYPEWPHILGHDDLGRDIFIRLLYAGQVSLSVAVFAALFGGVVGLFLGLLAGASGGRVDAYIMRFTDFIISLPLLPLLIVVSAIDFSKLGLAFVQEQNLLKIIVIISFLSWPLVARLVRAKAREVRNLDFVKSARALGLSKFKITLRHILPNVMGPVIVALTLSIGNIILLESALSFLGLGIQPPRPSWGNMLANAQELIWIAPHIMIYPGVMIFLSVLAFNILGD
ncbi:MAG: NAD synthetase, partial [Rickettsiales bacterium]|nr:NAD synthetase [Rickettsiales bacterium]